MLGALRNLTYRHGLTSLAPTLRMRELLKSAYFHLLAPRERVRVKLAGASGSFFVRSPSELRMLERAVRVKDSGAWEVDLLELFAATVLPGDIVYDIGANVGLYSIFLSKRAGPRGRVIAFEPDSRNYARLQENVRLNGLANVACFQKALGEQSQKSALYAHKDNPGASTLRASRDPAYTCAEVVEVENGDAFRATLRLPIPRVVKIDVEGSEYSVLRGLIRTLREPSCEFLGCEVHPQALPPGVTSRHLCELLRSLGFERIEPYRRGRQLHLVCRKQPPVYQLTCVHSLRPVPTLRRGICRGVMFLWLPWGLRK